jgi:hypothetical protein
VEDCFAPLEVLAREAEGIPETAFAGRYQASQRSCVRVFVESRPLDMKDILKARGQPPMLCLPVDPTRHGGQDIVPLHR